MSGFTNRAKQLFAAVKSGDPIARLDRSADAESLWPAKLEEEADKSATILRSFFLDGFIVPYRTLAVCPQDVVRKCHGLAVFHLLREGLSSPTASGSGTLITRLPDGKWSGASAILVDNKASLPPGVDAMDVVLVINDKSALDALLDSVVALQKCVTIAPGPIPRSEAPYNRTSPATQNEVPVWSYVKSNGELVETDLGHLVVRQSTEENQRFYGVPNITGREILSGQVKTPAGVSDYLQRTIHTLEQQSGSLSGLPKPGKCPGDRRVRAPSGTA